MTPIPEDVQDAIAAMVEKLADEKADCTQEEKVGALFDAMCALILSERDKARKEERDRLANMIDPEIGLPSDALLRRVHADVETRGRKNSNFAVTVHHRNIVVSAVASAIRQEPQGEKP